MRSERMEAQEHRRVLKVVKAVASTIGRDFFRSLVEQLAGAAGGDCAYVAELIDRPKEKLRSVAVWRDGTPSLDFEQDLPDTVASQVLLDGSVSWSRNARLIFPLDSVLQDLRAEGYVGVRLRDSDGQYAGLIGVSSRQPLSSPTLLRSVLETLAPRTAAELERKRAEDALQEREQRYRAFISASSDAMWRIEFEQPIPLDLPEEEQIERIYRYGYVAEANEATARLTGASCPEELVGTKFADLFAEKADSRIREELRSAIRTGYRAESTATTPVDKDGRTSYRLGTRCWIVESNELRRVWGTTRDITDLKRAELAAEAAERRFREVLENIRLPALMLDPGGAITFCNDFLARLANSSKDDLRGKNWLEFIASSGDVDTWASLLSGRPAEAPASEQHFESIFRPPDAAPRIVVWDTIVLRDEAGETAGLAAIGKDITDQRALEGRLSQAERLESIGRLAGGVAHDFNNLLTVIMGYLAMALDEVEPTLATHEALVNIESAVNQCAVLTKQLLAIGRKQRLRPELISLNSIIAGEETMIRSMIGPDITFITHLDPSLGLVFADAAQIRRILANLATNARDAMPGGGTLTIATKNVSVGPDAQSSLAVSSGPYVRLAISDTGIGLTEEVKKHMFDPFFTTKAPGKGTGLGLSTVYGIVAQSGGHISARSEPGKGTTIEILLPRREERTEP